MFGRATLTIPASPSAIAVAEAVTAGFAAEAGLDGVDADRLQRAVRCLIAFSVERSYEGRAKGDVELSLELDPTGVQVAVHDWGRPYRRGGGPDGPLPEGLEDAVAIDPDARLINLAGDGKRLALRIEAAHAVEIAPVIDGAGDAERVRADAVDGIEIRDATTADADAIAQLVYGGYGLGYVHADFYRPAWIDDAMRAGHVSSTVAYADDELIGHHALLCSGPGEAAESGVAVIAHAWRGLGLFDRMFAVTVERAKRLGLPALYGQATTAHIYSQRSEFKCGYRPTALMIGATPASMGQAQSDAKRARSGRGALLNSVLPLVDAPVLRGASPARYAPVIERLAGDAGFAFAPADGIGPAVLTDELMHYSERNVTVIHVSGTHDPHRLERMLWSEEARQAGTLYADIDLACPDDDAVELLRREGFFLAGFVHTGRAGRDWLRLQRPQDAADVEAIHVEGETAAWLLEQVLADRASVA